MNGALFSVLLTRRSCISCSFVASLITNTFSRLVDSCCCCFSFSPVSKSPASSSLDEQNKIIDIKVIPFNCIAHPFCASFFAWLARARARARSELDRFSMEAELFREINGRFLLNELGDPTFLFHLFEENTTLHDIFKFEELFIIQLCGSRKYPYPHHGGNFT